VLWQKASRAFVVHGLLASDATVFDMRDWGTEAIKMKREWQLEAITETGETVHIEPYITNRDVKIISCDRYSDGNKSGTRMSVEVTRVDLHAQPSLDIRAVTRGQLKERKRQRAMRLNIGS
jgi:hypothetical protein